MSWEAKTTLIHLKAELLCRNNLLKDTGEDDLPKKPNMTHTHKVLESSLDCVSTDGKITYPLRCASKRQFVQKKIAFVLNSIASEREKEREANMPEGEHMRVTTMIKMRLVHGEFCVNDDACIQNVLLSNPVLFPQSAIQKAIVGLSQ